MTHPESDTKKLIDTIRANLSLGSPEWLRQVAVTMSQQLCEIRQLRNALRDTQADLAKEREKWGAVVGDTREANLASVLDLAGKLRANQTLLEDSAAMMFRLADETFQLRQGVDKFAEHAAKLPDALAAVEKRHQERIAD